MRPPEHPPGDIFVSRSLTHRLLSIITAQSGKCSAQRQPREPAPRRARLRQDCLVKVPEHGWKVSAAMDIVPPKRGETSSTWLVGNGVTVLAILPLDRAMQ